MGLPWPAPWAPALIADVDRWVRSFSTGSIELPPRAITGLPLGHADAWLAHVLVGWKPSTQFNLTVPMTTVFRLTRS